MKNTDNVLLKNLSDDKLVHLDELKINNNQTSTTDSIDIDVNSNNIIANNGKINKDIYAWGLSTAGKYFIPSAFPTPSKNDENILIAQKNK
ncbi:hypothetical protein [Apilactobacillus ozensis]|uniref:hypothetical protein n=1 Tax=Apilactobacillus ozensis TaxID=866801 RepID=UPI000AFD9A1A|nr:hypothetical protein [Apilactobacillus ozensis]